MENTFKALMILAVLGCFVGGSVAYTPVNNTVTYTYDEIPDRLSDNIVVGVNDSIGSLGTTLGKYIVLLFYFSLFIMLIWAVKRWLI